MIASIRNEHVKMLYTLAEDDQRVLEYALPDAIFGFHCQQACEKALKALISAHHQKYAFTHIISELLAQVAACGETLPSFSYPVVELQTFAVEFRYNYGPVIEEPVRNSMRSSTGMLLGFVLDRILVLQEELPTA